MLRRNKLDCSVSDEISSYVMQHLIKLKVNPEEAYILSRKYKNIKLALQNLSRPLKEYSNNLHYEEQKVKEENKIVEIKVMSQSKKKIYDRLIELNIGQSEAEFMSLNCDSLEEALQNLGFSFYPLPKKQEVLDAGAFSYSSKQGHTEKCSICLEFYQNKDILKSLPCLHRFHKTCIDQWISAKKNKCPECNSEIKYEFN